MQPVGLTLFVVLSLVAQVTGLVVGAVGGGRYFGWPGAIIGGIIGIFAGHFLIRFPELMAERYFLKKINNSSTAELWEMIARERNQWNFFTTFALLNLSTRGEKVEVELPGILEMLRSADMRTRVFGWDALRLVFTEQAQRIEGYDPREPTEVCQRKCAMLWDSGCKLGGTE